VGGSGEGSRDGGTALGILATAETAGGNAIARATATGGAGGDGRFPGDGGDAASQADATNSGATGAATATASATGGRGGQSNRPSIPGNATAVANAVATHGAAATADAGAFGSGDTSARANATTAMGAQAIGTAFAQGIDGIARSSAKTTGSVFPRFDAAAAGDGSATAKSAVNIGGPFQGLDTTGTLQAYSFATGLPSAAFVSAAVTGNPNVAAAFASDGVLGAGAMGGAYRTDGPAVSRVYLSTFDFTFDTDAFAAPGNLRLGFYDEISFGSGFDALLLRVLFEGNTVIDELFTTLAAAHTYFDDKVLNLGAFALGDMLDLNFIFALESDQPGDGFGVAFLFGADTAAVAPPPSLPTSVPEPPTLLLLASSFGLLLLLRRRRGMSNVA
jgi:hypothetical protein